MRKYIIAALCAALTLLCACGGGNAPAETPAPEPVETEVVTATVEPTAEPTVEPTVEPTAEPTVEPTAEPTAEPTKTPVVTSAPVVVTPEPTPTPDPKTVAELYIGSSVESLYAAIGYPLSSDYAPSCLGAGEDGNLYYDGFTVYTYREDGIETVNHVE